MVGEGKRKKQAPGSFFGKNVFSPYVMVAKNFKVISML